MASRNYSAPKQSPQGETKARYSLDVAFSFDVLKGNATISFTSKDVFNSRNRSSISKVENFVSESKRQ
ncbi:MAG: hypothetical protein COA97_12965 [Flavobacteriales bacterium]|nr:MAG: hypothetical protein COA97_12965 [Flavobacteriales bacterium]